MGFTFLHNNFNVLDMDKSVAFYEKALELVPVEIFEAADKSFKLVYLGDAKTHHKLELTWIKDRNEPYNLGENEFHLAFATDDMKKSFALHSEMGCVCYENADMGIYFISDPDGYWIEILPADR